MSRKRYTPEQIIGKLREAEVALSAEAVEKGTFRSFFFQMFVFIDPPQKLQLTDYNL